MMDQFYTIYESKTPNIPYFELLKYEDLLITFHYVLTFYRPKN